jgi:hypothetical protein
LRSIEQSIWVGRTALRTRFYKLPKETVMISEWATLCPNLPGRLTSDDAVIEQFMKPLKLAVLEYRLENPGEYEKAKKKVKLRAKFPQDSQYRSLCFTQMEQQLRTLARK